MKTVVFKISFWFTYLLISGAIWILGIGYGFGFNFFNYLGTIDFLKSFILPFTRNSFFLFVLLFVGSLQFGLLLIFKKTDRIFVEKDIRIFYFTFLGSSGILFFLASGYIRNFNPESFFPEFAFGSWLGSLVIILLNRYSKQLSIFTIVFSFLLSFILAFSFYAGMLEATYIKKGNGFRLTNVYRNENKEDSTIVGSILIITTEQYHLLYNNSNKAIKVLNKNSYESLEFQKTQ